MNRNALHQINEKGLQKRVYNISVSLIQEAMLTVGPFLQLSLTKHFFVRTHECLLVLSGHALG